MAGAETPAVVVVGSVNRDVVLPVPHLPLPGETVLAEGQVELVGGKGGNQAVAAARLGCRVALVGLTGADADGAAVRAALTAEGVDVEHLGVADAPTGRAVVMVDTGAENAIVVVAGANGALGPADVGRAADAVSRAAVVVAQLEVPLAAVLEAARRRTGTFLLNPAPARPLPAELLAEVDVLVVNETECGVVLGAPPDRPDGVAARASALGVRGAVVVTLGARGAVVCTGVGTGPGPGTDAGTVHVPAPEVDAVDTTGAGDTFVGALADALARGEDLVGAVRWAVDAAALSTRALGATSGMPSRDEVLALRRPV